MSNRRFNLAHLSDPHLTGLAGVGVQQLLNKRLLGYLSWWKSRRRHYRREILDRVVSDMRQQSPDHILVSGDLTHIGLPQEHVQALQWLESIGTAQHISLIPGNHERYVRANWDTTLGLWSDYLGCATEAGFPTLTARGPIAVIGVNSAVPTAPFLATGRVGPRQLARLRSLLQETGSQGLFRLVMIHHSPLLRGHSRRKHLTDASALTRLLAEVGAELVVHGHGHVENIGSIETPGGAIPVLAAPSASRVGRGCAGWNKLGISAQPEHWLIELECRRYYPAGRDTKGADAAAEMRITTSREFQVSRARLPVNSSRQDPTRSEALPDSVPGSD